MSDYIDSYFDTADANAFLEVLATQANIIGPVAGREDVPGTNPARLYLAVRTSEPLAVPEGAVATDPATAQALLGVWA